MMTKSKRSMRSSGDCSLGSSFRPRSRRYACRSASTPTLRLLGRIRKPALATGLVEQHSRRDRDVEAVRAAEHRQAYGNDGRVGPLAAQTLGLAAEDDRDG